MHGYPSKILRVDLSHGTITREEPDEQIIRDYIGGIGIGVRTVYDEVMPGTDALDPENRMVLAVSPLTGTPVPGACRYHVVAKSPQTMFTLSVADSAGFFAPEFRFAGCDAIIFQGAAPEPVYLWIKDGAVEIRDAGELWGKDTFETEDLVRQQLGDTRIKVLAIGPAGENRVRLACIVNDKGHVAARGGFGAVMGAKNLKAIAVRGSNRPGVFDRERVIELARIWREAGVKSPLHRWGTAASVDSYYKKGILPIKNLTTNSFDYEKLTGRYIRQTYKLKPKRCFGCFMNHVHDIEVTEGPYKGFVGEEPEYELLAGFGSNLGISDPGAVAMLGDRCDRLGMDAIGAAWAISLAMEAVERGLISKKDMDGLDLKWGNTEAAATLMEKMALRQGFGDVLADGAALAAQRIGGEAQNFVVTTHKNMSPKCIDTRSMPGRSLAFSVASSGPTTEHAPGLHAGLPDPELGFAQGLDMRSPEGQAQAVRMGGARKVFVDSLGVCSFTIPSPALTRLLEAFAAVTGRKIDFDEALAMGERIINLERCFNIRHGLTPKHDSLSERLLSAPTDGPAKGIGSKPHMDRMVRDYYQVMGWDFETGKPLKQTLDRLGLNKEKKDLWG